MTVIVERKYVDGPFGQVHVTEMRPDTNTAKPTLVCFHQSPVSGAQYALFQKEMAVDRVVLCPDTPGFGSSDSPSFVPSMEDYATALADALTNLGFGNGKQVDVLGFHTGSQICVEMAAARPDLVRRLVLSSLALMTEDERTSNRAAFGGPRPLFMDPDYVPRYYDQQVLNGLEGVGLERRLELFAERMRPGSLSWYGPEAVFTHDTESRLKDVNQPTLLYILRDTLSENTRRAASLVARAIIKERMDIHGPAGWDSHPEIIASDVRSFLDADL